MRSYLLACMIGLMTPVAQALAPPAPAIGQFSVSPDNTLVIWEFNAQHTRPVGQTRWSRAPHPRLSNVTASNVHQPFPSYICEAHTLYKTDPGREPRAILKVPKAAFCTVVHNEMTILVAAAGSIFRSQDEGKTFQPVPSSGPYQGWDFQPPQLGGMIATTIARGPEQSGMGPLLSTDAGSTWRKFTYPHYTGRPVSTVKGKLYASTRKGLWRSDNLGDTWVADSNGMPVKCEHFLVGGGPDGTLYAWSKNAVFFRPTGQTRWSRLELPEAMSLKKDAC